MSGFLNSFFGMRKKNIFKKPEELHKKDSFLGEDYEVCGVIGEGGFGVVYLVRDIETNSFFAVKTLREEYAEDAGIKDRFCKEVQAWMDLERHPYIVQVYAVLERYGKLYIHMDLVLPCKHGLNSLEKYLIHEPPDLIQSLRWSIQFCYGMEYAYSRGIRCHRDIKPANILISKDKTVKISDFGLADILGSSKAISEIRLNIRNGKIGLSGQTTMEGIGFGTPTYMPPEQFYNAAKCDERSDIYSFGIVLYQMATKGEVPFFAPLPKDDSKQGAERFWAEMHKLHSESSIPKLNSTLFSAIQRCTAKRIEDRYQTFKELREDLEALLKQQTGEVIKPPELAEIGLGGDKEALKWLRKGLTLRGLGRYDEAIACYDKVLEINPADAEAWRNKAFCFRLLERYDEILHCLNKALEFGPNDALTWTLKGQTLAEMSRFEEAICCYDRVLEIDPRDADVRQRKAVCKNKIGK